MRGQKARKGDNGVRLGFEGGQTPLYRRLPKFVSSPHRGHVVKKFTLIKLSMLNAVEDGADVDYQSLMDRGLATKPRRTKRVFKVVGGELLERKNLTVRAHAFTKSAESAIVANGGRCILMSRTRPIPLEEDLREKKQASIERRKALVARRKLLKAKSSTLGGSSQQ